MHFFLRLMCVKTALESVDLDGRVTLLQCSVCQRRLPLPLLHCCNPSTDAVTQCGVIVVVMNLFKI